MNQIEMRESKYIIILLVIVSFSCLGQSPNYDKSDFYSTLNNTLFVKLKDSVKLLIEDDVDVKELGSSLFGKRSKALEKLILNSKGKNEYLSKLIDTHNLGNAYNPMWTKAVAIDNSLGIDQMLKSLIVFLNDKFICDILISVWFNRQYGILKGREGDVIVKNTFSVNELNDQNISRFIKEVGLYYHDLQILTFQIKFIDLKYQSDGKSGRGQMTAGINRTTYDYKTKIFSSEFSSNLNDLERLNDFLYDLFGLKYTFSEKNKYLFENEKVPIRLTIKTNFENESFREKLYKAIETLKKDDHWIESLPNCGCDIESVKDEGWIIKNGFSTVRFENGLSYDIEYSNSTWRWKGILYDETYDSYRELIEELIEECKYYSCDN